MLIVYIPSSGNEGELYIFFSTDIQRWKRTTDNKFLLNLRASTYRDDLHFYRFDDSKLQLIKSIIASAEISGEFHDLVYATALLTAPLPRLQARLSSGGA